MNNISGTFKTKLKSDLFYGAIFNQFRYYLFRLTDLNSNKNHLDFYFFVSLIYNLFFSLIPLIIIFPIIVNYVFVPNSDDIQAYINFNNMMSKFMFMEYISCFLLLLNLIINTLVADYKIPFVYNRGMSFVIYITKFSNLYKLFSSLILIILFHVYGHFDNTNWYINLNVLGSNYLPSSNPVINQYESWNPGQLIFVTLFIFNIISIVPNLILAFRDKKYILNKNSVLNEIKKNWKIPFYATLCLVLIIFVFSFIILKTEESYYADWVSQNPGQSLEDAPNYGYSPKNYWEAIWYCLITITTVGYGQIIPQANASRIVAVFLIIIGVSYYSFYSVFFVTLYSKFLNNNKKTSQSDLTQIKKDLINELVKFKVIDEEIYKNVTKSKKHFEKSINQQNNLLSLINSNFKNNIPLKTEFNYDTFNELNIYNSSTIMLSMDHKQINDLLNSRSKNFIISYNPFILMNKINKIVLYDSTMSATIMEFGISSPTIKTIKNKKYIKYCINNISMYSEKNKLNITDFNNGNYLYIN